jgi:hypothetical protein
MVVAAWRWPSPPVPGAVLAAACYFAAFAAVYPDADIAHRLVLAPGLLLIAAAAQQTEGDDRRARVIRLLLLLALAISVAQIARSLWIYLSA